MEGPDIEAEQVHIEVAIIGAVGSLDTVGNKGEKGKADAMGKLILDRLKENDVDVEGVLILEDQQTGYAHINIDRSDPSNPRITTMGKANARLTPEMFTAFPYPRPDLLLLQQEINLPTVHHWIMCANREKVTVLLNAAPKKLDTGSYLPAR